MKKALISIRGHLCKSVTLHALLVGRILSKDKGKLGLGLGCIFWGLWHLATMAHGHPFMGKCLFMWVPFCGFVVGIFGLERFEEMSWWQVEDCMEISVLVLL